MLAIAYIAHHNDTTIAIIMTIVQRFWLKFILFFFVILFVALLTTNQFFIAINCAPDSVTITVNKFAFDWFNQSRYKAITIFIWNNGFKQLNIVLLSQFCNATQSNVTSNIVMCWALSVALLASQRNYHYLFSSNFKYLLVLMTKFNMSCCYWFATIRFNHPIHSITLKHKWTHARNIQ